MNIHFGTAGIPLSAGNMNTKDGIEFIKKIGLDAMEIEFVRGVYIKRESDAQHIKNAAKINNVKLSIHAPYYINLNSNEKNKIIASEKRIIDCVRIAHYIGAASVVIHSAYYMKMNKEDVYSRVKGKYKDIIKRIKGLGYDNIILRPELMGKHSQFGNADELIKLSQDIGDGILPCIDFAHYEARYGEEKNCYKGFCELFDKIENGLGKQALKNMHIHFSAVEYSDKGERNHLMFDEGRLQWKDMIKCWKDYHIKGIAISESPNIEIDAITAKRYYLSL